MRFPPVLELSMIGVVDAGIPNQERLVLRPSEEVNLAQFGMLLGVGDPDTYLLPISDDFFWFGDRIVEPPSWIVLYTGKGVFRETHLVNSGQKVLVFHWGKEHTVFDIPGLAPVLVRFDSVLVSRPPTPLKALGSGTE